jgi:hypothetical protein
MARRTDSATLAPLLPGKGGATTDTLCWRSPPGVRARAARCNRSGRPFRVCSSSADNYSATTSSPSIGRGIGSRYFPTAATGLSRQEHKILRSLCRGDHNICPAMSETRNAARRGLPQANHRFYLNACSLSALAG